MPDGGSFAAVRGSDLAVFMRVMAKAGADTDRPFCHGLGLTPEALETLVLRYPELLPLVPAGDLGSDAGADTLEEPDLRALLLDHASHREPPPETIWLAAIVARACQGSRHLWQDLGLDHRGQLSALLDRHFGPLARANSRDMKWKKYFYRCLCEREGISFCPSPQCDRCSDLRTCFGPEA